MFHCDDIAPAVRHGLMIVRKLKLHDHTMLTPEKIFASGKIEFPHPYKTAVIQSGHPVPVREKPHPPVAQRLGVMAAQDLSIKNFQSLGLGGANKLGDGGKVAPGENIACQPPVHRGRPVVYGDAVNHGDAARGEKASHNAEIGRYGGRADMFQHADRYDPVKTAVLVPVIAKGEVQLVGETIVDRSPSRIGKLSFRQGDAGHGHIFAALRHRSGEPAPSASDIKHPVARLQIQLGGKPRKLRHLRQFEAVIGLVEVAA